MYPRKPLSHAEQLVRMKRCLGRLRTQLRHRYDEFFEATKGRRECALEVQLRSRLLEATRDVVALGEACLEELRRQELLFYAPFKPGDRILIDRAGEGITTTLGPYLIVDVCPDKRRAFHYRAVELTKKGAVSKRGTVLWLSPRASATIRTERSAGRRRHGVGVQVLPGVCPDLTRARLREGGPDVVRARRGAARQPEFPKERPNVGLIRDAPLRASAVSPRARPLGLIAAPDRA